MTTLQSDSGTAAAEWKRGWKLAMACFVGFSFFSIMTNSLGVFMVPVTREFGWTRTLFSSGIAIAAIAVAILSPFFGILIDRYGPRRVALPGLVAAAFAISCFSLASGSQVQWLALWGFYAVVSISVKTTVWTAAIVGTFSRSQGLALGVVLSGTAAAHMIFPPLATWLIDQVGWRGAYAWLGWGWGALTFVLCYLFLADGYERKGSKAQRGPRSQEGLTGLTIAQARRSSSLWRIGIATFVMMVLTIGLIVHQIPILISVGVTATKAAWLASIAGGAGIVGKIVSGALLDRFAPNWVGGLTLGVTALAFLLLMDGFTSTALILIGMIVNGYAAGSTLQIASYLTARYAGMRHFGVIYGMITSVVALGSGLGPILAGYIFDTTGGYSAFLLAGTIACVVCSLLILSLPAYPDWARPAPTPAARRPLNGTDDLSLANENGRS